MSYKIKLTNYAIEQLTEINRYISHTLMEPEVARKWMQRVKAEFASLNTMPKRYPLIDEEKWRSEGIRKMPIENFISYYWVDEEEKVVWITAIVYGRRDQFTALRNMPTDLD